MWTQAIYGSVTIAAVSRICAVPYPSYGVPQLHVAVLGWAAAFLGFAKLMSPRSPASISALRRHEVTLLRKIDYIDRSGSHG